MARVFVKGQALEKLMAEACDEWASTHWEEFCHFRKEMAIRRAQVQVTPLGYVELEIPKDLDTIVAKRIGGNDTPDHQWTSDKEALEAFKKVFMIGCLTTGKSTNRIIVPA